MKDFIYIPEEDIDKLSRLELRMNTRIARAAIKGPKINHYLGMCIGDINQDNFIFGKYLDFSCAWIAPLPLLTRWFGDDFKPLREHLDDHSAIVAGVCPTLQAVSLHPLLCPPEPDVHQYTTFQSSCRLP
jgi:hypothetical protein